MTYALIVDNAISLVLRKLPAQARDQRTNEWVAPSGGDWTAEDLARCGFVLVVETPRPTPPPGQKVTGRTVELAAGVPTEVWTVEAKTQAELDADIVQAAREAERVDLIGAKRQQVLDRMNILETQVANFAAQSDATNNASAINLLNQLKNTVIPLIVAELVAAGRRDVMIVKLALE